MGELSLINASESRERVILRFYTTWEDCFILTGLTVPTIEIFFFRNPRDCSWDIKKLPQVMLCPLSSSVISNMTRMPWFLSETPQAGFTVYISWQYQSTLWPLFLTYIQYMIWLHLYCLSPSRFPHETLKTNWCLSLWEPKQMWWEGRQISWLMCHKRYIHRRGIYSFTVSKIPQNHNFPPLDLMHISRYKIHFNRYGSNLTWKTQIFVAPVETNIKYET